MSKKYALVIGIENYPEKSGQSKVPFAAADCRALAEYDHRLQPIGLRG